MHLVIDNYDSFTFNVVQYLQIAGADVLVRRHDEITIAEIERHLPQSLIVSPGPCTPDEAGISLEAIRHFSGRIPILGICLGHQCIGQAFGARVVRAAVPVHGKASRIRHDGSDLFQGVPRELMAGRYHSLVVEDLPACLVASAHCVGDVPDAKDMIMALRHVSYPVHGIQFHPESILTDEGLRIIRNFLAISAENRDFMPTPVQPAEIAAAAFVP